MTYEEWKKAWAEASAESERHVAATRTTYALGNSLLHRVHRVQDEATRTYRVGGELAIEVRAYGGKLSVSLMEGNTVGYDKSTMAISMAMAIVHGFIERWRAGGPEMPPSGDFTMELTLGPCAFIRRMLNPPKAAP